MYVVPSALTFARLYGTICRDMHVLLFFSENLWTHLQQLYKTICLLCWKRSIYQKMSSTIKKVCVFDAVQSKISSHLAMCQSLVSCEIRCTYVFTEKRSSKRCCFFTAFALLSAMLTKVNSLRRLTLAECSLTEKSVNQISSGLMQGLKPNTAPEQFTCLDFSGNTLKDVCLLFKKAVWFFWLNLLLWVLG